MVEIITIIFAIIGGFTVLIFLMRLLLRRNVEEIKFNPSKYGSIANEQDIKTRVDQLLSQNNKIQAIKYLKENKKLSLIEAKNMI